MMKDQTDSFEYLLSHVRNEHLSTILNSKNDENKTALYLSSEHNKHNVIVKLLAYDNILLNDQYEVNGYTPLMICAEKGNLNCTKV